MYVCLGMSWSRCCPMHVFDVEEVPKIGKRAVVRNARDCTTCRECLESFPGQENGSK